MKVENRIKGKQKDRNQNWEQKVEAENRIENKRKTFNWPMISIRVEKVEARIRIEKQQCF